MSTLDESTHDAINDLYDKGIIDLHKILTWLEITLKSVNPENTENQQTDLKDQEPLKYQDPDSNCILTFSIEHCKELFALLSFFHNDSQKSDNINAILHQQVFFTQLDDVLKCIVPYFSDVPDDLIGPDGIGLFNFLILSKDEPTTIITPKNTATTTTTTTANSGGDDSDNGVDQSDDDDDDPLAVFFPDSTVMNNTDPSGQDILDLFFPPVLDLSEKQKEEVEEELCVTTECLICGDDIKAVKIKQTRFGTNNHLKSGHDARYYFDNSVIDGIKLLPCMHTLHLTCYKEYIIDAIQNSTTLEQLWCPCKTHDDDNDNDEREEEEQGHTTKKCPRLTYRFLQSFLSTDLYTKYCQRLDSLALASVAGISRCPKCSQGLDISLLLNAHNIQDSHGLPTSDRIQNCTMCQTQYCIACNTIILAVDDKKKHLCKDVEKDANIQGGNTIDMVGHQSCPTCGLLIVRIDGCNWILCRCGQQFCYQCRRLMDKHEQCECGVQKYKNDKELYEVKY